MYKFVIDYFLQIMFFNYFYSYHLINITYRSKFTPTEPLQIKYTIS